MSIETCTSSNLLVASAAICARPAKLCSAQLIPAAADCTLVIHDNAASGAGNVLLKMSLKANAAGDTAHLTVPIEANNGLYATVTGTGAAFIVHFSPL